ncbi:MAG: helix-turn-helix domain-containing protein [Verrucomicrobiae bacterium]|nr:helix-turn-helix domain-containing protein [Verrucomicrobiae bacterium]
MNRKNNEKIRTWIPGKLLFHPFKLISMVRYPPDCGGPFHEHDVFQELLVVSGRFDLADPRGCRMCVEPGEMLVIPPGRKHSWDIGKNGCVAFQMFHFPLLLENFGELSILFGNVDLPWQKVRIGQNAMKQVWSRLQGEFKKKQAADSVMIFAGLLELLALALRRHVQGKGVGHEGKPGDMAVKKALAHIHGCYRGKMPLNVLAQKAGLSPSRFSEVFRKYTGLAPVKYLNEYRLEKARTLMAYSEMPVKEVSAYLGFESIHYFSRSFKKRFGRSPSGWRA